MDYFYSIKETADGGFICGGFSYSNISGDKTENNMGPNFFNDFWVLKFDAAGNIQWQNTIGGSWDDLFYTISPCNDGGYICGGMSDSFISGDKTEDPCGLRDYWVVKLDSTGNIQWQNTIGGNIDDWLYSISPTQDGGYICGGYSTSYDTTCDKTEMSTGGNYWIVKLDALGNIQWDNTIGGSGGDELWSISQTVDDGYILGGFSNSNISGDKTENCIGGMDYWIVKTDSSGNIQWQNTIGGNDEDKLFSISQTNDGGFICGGYSLSNISGDKTENCIGGKDYWIVKIDANGNIQWENTIGGVYDDYIFANNCIFQTTDGGYICGGTSNSNISGDKTENVVGKRDYWIIKLYPDSVTGISDLELPKAELKIYPNPAGENLTLTLSKGEGTSEVQIEILDLLGREVLQPQASNITIEHQTTINITSLSPGIYIAQVKQGEKAYREKFVKQ